MSILIEPQWQIYQPFVHNSIDAKFLSWLLGNGSLTKRLQAHCGQFKVELLFQRWCSIFPSERHLLAIPQGRWANVREVKLICDNQPWVYARSVFPRTTLCGDEKALLKLGSKALGQRLFEASTLERSEFEVARISPGHYQYHHASCGINPTTDLFGRRSVFYLNKKPLLVSEMFTPYFPYFN